MRRPAGRLMETHQRTAPPDARQDDALQARVLVERVTMLFDRNRMPAATVVPFALLITWYLWDVTPHSHLLAWLALKAVASALMIGVDLAYRRRGAARPAGAWLRLYLGLLAIDGASWSLMGTWLVPMDRPDLVAVMFAVVAGVGAVGGVALNTFVQATAVFSGSLLLPVIGWHLLHPTQLGLFAAAGATAYLGLLVHNGHLAARSTLELVRLRFEYGTVAEQRARALESAERSSAVKSQFLATMSHEMRTPLHGILGTVALMHERSRLPADREQLELVERSGQHLLGMINDILDFSRIEAGGTVLEDQPFDLTATVEDVVRLWRADAQAKGLDLGADICAPQPWVRGDATRLRQILHNLVGNAVKFTDRGEVAIRVFVDGGRLRIAVRDTGIGIAPEDLSRVFEPFHQADNSYARRHAGTGLGLAISRELARAMDGDVTAESAPGGGTVFTLDLPWSPTDAPAASDGVAGRPESVRSLKGRVLLAEDNPVNVRVALAMLKKLGLEVVVAEDGEQAVASYQAQKPDAVLMDCHMPVVDGFAATSRIRELEAQGGGARVPILAVTANAFPEDRERCLAAGMDDYLSKPFTADDLTRMLERHLTPSETRVA